MTIPPGTPTTEPSHESARAHLQFNWFAHEANRLLEATRNRYGDFETTDHTQAPNLAAAQAYATLALVIAVDDVTACLERHVGGVT